MRSVITAKIKIGTIPEIIRTIKVYKRGLQFCVNQAWKRNIRNNIKLHPFVYTYLKKIGLPSQLAIACIKQACGIVKKAKNKPMIKFCSIRYNFPRSASFKDGILSISTIKGRIRIPFTIPDCYAKYFSWDVEESLLRMDKKGRCFFLFTFSKEVNATNNASQNIVLGIDFGIKNLAVCSDNRFFKDSRVKQTKRKYRYLRSKLQAKGTRSSLRLLKKISGREKRFMAWINHNISKSIVSNFSGNKIVMENLKGIRKINRGKRLNYWISNWSFFQLQRFITYKAQMRGIKVVKVNPAYTSQICSCCGNLGSLSKSVFSCHCGFSLNRDLNASRNLAHPKLVERQALVTKPYIQTDESKGSLRTIACEVMDKSPTL